MSESETQPDVLEVEGTFDLLELEAKSDPQLELIEQEQYEQILSDQGQPLFQVQGIPDQGQAYLMEVGISVDKPHLLIQEYDLNRFYRIQLLSSVYHPSDLLDPQSSCWVPMVQLKVCHSLPGPQKERICGEELMKLMFSFHTFQHLKEERTLLSLASSKEIKHQLSGFFRITLHLDTRYEVQETLTEFPGNEEMIRRLGAWLLDPEMKKFMFQQRRPARRTSWKKRRKL